MHWPEPAVMQIPWSRRKRIIEKHDELERKKAQNQRDEESKARSRSRAKSHRRR